MQLVPYYEQKRTAVSVSFEQIKMEVEIETLSQEVNLMQNNGSTSRGGSLIRPTTVGTFCDMTKGHGTPSHAFASLVNI